MNPHLNNKNRFRSWDSCSKHFVRCGVNQEQQQFIGIFDKNMKEIFEGDVVEFDKHEGTAKGVVQYYNNYCAYAIDSDIGVVPFMDISINTLEVVGNMVEDYMWDESGEKLVKVYEDTNS